MVGGGGELAYEQRYVDGLYARLDALRQRTADALGVVRRTPPSGSPQNRSERDAYVHLHENRLMQLRSVEDRLVFGRLDLTGGRRHYVGRLGIADDDHVQLLVDWRAPVAQPFYAATAAAPGDVVRRRHLVTRGRTVTGVEDDVLDLDALDSTARSRLNGEGALLAALDADRTGRMGDIVATIQAEQDRIIRSDLPGVLVVQGGPGTGKTAVALHRAAYLLYTHRERLSRSGVLLVGPSTVFLRYIDQVLPSLGETGVVTATPGQLFAGVDVAAVDPPAVAALKGDLRMAELLANAVAARQRVPTGPQTLDVDGSPVVLTPPMVAAARDRARRSGRPHNLARAVFVKDVLGSLADRLTRSYRSGMSAADRADVIGELRSARDVRVALNRAWLPLTPPQLLEFLYAHPGRLAAAAPHLSPPERALLFRERGAGWTVEDVPLLDEAAELLGEDDAPARVAARQDAAQRSADLAYARGALQISGGGLVSAETLADRFADHGPALTLAERAARDRSWAYGHVVVDEAQELSPMMWRLLMRRCPTRSMTVVGDIAQTSAAAGAQSWAEVLDPYVAGRWRLEELSVNYRTPAQIMAVAAGVLTAAGVDVRPPTSVRSSRWPPTAIRVPPPELTGAALVGAVQAELALSTAGRLAVITPRGRRGAAVDALTAGLAEGTVAAGARGLDTQVAVLTVAEAKGLEFDAVLLLEPAEILAGSARGANDLYVALTRPTQRLRVLHAGELPAGLEGLAPAAGGSEAAEYG